MIRTIIIDADPALRKQLQHFLLKYPACIVVACCNSIADSKILIPATKPDLLLLDAELNDGSAIELLNFFTKSTFKVICITAGNPASIKAIYKGALNYLSKPINQIEFASTLKKIVEKLPAPSIPEYLEESENELNITRKRIVLRVQQYMLVVALNEIIYCHSNAGYTTFYLTGNRKELVSNPIKEYEQLLPETWFLRPHQSYLVNNNFIDRYNKDGFLLLKNGSSIPVATRKKDYVVKMLLQG